MILKSPITQELSVLLICKLLLCFSTMNLFRHFQLRATRPLITEDHILIIVCVFIFAELFTIFMCLQFRCLIDTQARICSISSAKFWIFCVSCGVLKSLVSDQMERIQWLNVEEAWSLCFSKQLITKYIVRDVVYINLISSCVMLTTILCKKVYNRHKCVHYSSSLTI